MGTHKQSLSKKTEEVVANEQTFGVGVALSRIVTLTRKLYGNVTRERLVPLITHADGSTLSGVTGALAFVMTVQSSMMNGPAVESNAGHVVITENGLVKELFSGVCQVFCVNPIT